MEDEHAMGNKPEDMDFVDMAMLDEIPELHLLEDGSTHELQIVKTEIGEAGEQSKSPGQKYLRLTYKAVDEPDTPLFNDIFMLPCSGIEKDQFNQRGRKLKDAFACFGFDYHGWNVVTGHEDLKNLVGEAQVKIAHPDNFDDQNQIRRYL